MRAGYLLLLGERREGWEALLVRIAGSSGLEVAYNHFPIAVLRAGACRALSLGEGGVVVGTLFHRHGPARPLLAVDADDARAIVSSGGDALLTRYWGGYVAALRRACGWTLLRDPSGGLPCYLASADGLTILASGADLLAGSGLVRPSIDWAALGRHLLSAGLPRRETVLDGVSELLPGFRIHGESRVQEMAWNPWTHVPPPNRFDPSAAAERLERAVRQSVQGWAASARHLLLAVSGGLDSSIVAASLKGSAAQVSCVTLYTDDPAGDERGYARSLCAALDLPLVEQAYRLDHVDLSRGFAPQLPRPVGRIQAQAYDSAQAEIAWQVGADAFMTGNGGDNVFGFSHSAAPIADRWLGEGLGMGLLATLGDTCRLTGCSARQALASTWRTLGRPYGWKANPRFLASPEGGSAEDNLRILHLLAVEAWLDHWLARSG